MQGRDVEKNKCFSLHRSPKILGERKEECTKKQGNRRKETSKEIPKETKVEGPPVKLLNARVGIADQTLGISEALCLQGSPP